MRELVLDVSKYDRGIDLEAWKTTRNLWGVIIKLGGHERAVGGRYKDSVADEHYANAKALGLHIGFYYYTDVCDVATANADANHFADLVGDKDYDLPLYMDVEDPNQFALSANTLTSVIKSFCDTLIYRGYYAGIYTSGSNWLNNMHSNELMDYANWIASWGPNWPTYAGDIGMWQQGCGDIHGNIAYDDIGESGYHDVDWCCIDYPSRINSGWKRQEEIKPLPIQNGSESLASDGFAYRAHVERAGWLPSVHDGKIAGTEGYKARLEALKFRPTEAMGELDVDIHMQSIGWKSYTGIKAGESSGESSSDIDPICGTVGESRRIEAVKLTLRNNSTGKKLRYIGHVEKIGWMDPVWEGEVCGTTGEGKRLEAIRIWLDDPNNPIDISMRIPQQEDVSTGRASDVIDAAYGELGYYAPDDPEPGSKYGRWMASITGEDWLAGPSTEIWWCCMFVSWCLAQGNVEMAGFPTQNTDLALNGGADAYAVDKYDVQYGDIIIFNWDWDSYTDHIGFATGEFDGNGFTTIEGNVGNAVQEKYRQMGNVAYVLRPPYNSHGPVGPNYPSIPTDPKNNRDGGKLDVDGIGGWNTIIDLQHIFGTLDDGVISGQNSEDNEYHWGMSNVEYDSGGSLLVEAIQRKIGANVDGYWGPNTSRKFQQYLNSLGYDLEIDGYFGRESVKALQDAINRGLITN